MNPQPLSRREFFVSVGRTLFRSRVARISLAVGIAAASVGFGCLIWQEREAVAGALAFVLVIVGILVAWELLPFSEETRAGWSESRKLAEQFPSYRWRNTLWVGLGLMAGRLWEASTVEDFDASVLLAPAIFIVIGVISNIIWRMRRGS